jgi:hypothetical protein
MNALQAWNCCSTSGRVGVMNTTLPCASLQQQQQQQHRQQQQQKQR